MIEQHHHYDHHPPEEAWISFFRLLQQDDNSTNATTNTLMNNMTDDTSTSTPTMAPTIMTNSNTTDTSDTEPVNPNDGEVLLTTLMIYGILFLIIWPLFCWLRLKYPKVYNVRGWVSTLKCKLAQNQYGCVSWLWELYDIPEKQIMDQCGLDSLCFLRLVRWAFLVACVGAFNAIWLIPVYGSSESSDATEYIEDYIVSITVAHVPPESSRLIATMLASYIVFGAALYLLYQEFEWFLAVRFRFLAQARARNYSVYVHGIPTAYQADYDLAEYFQASFGLGRVQEAHVRLQTPALLKVTQARDQMVQKLEHAINVFGHTGELPTHKVKGRGVVDSIEFYADELKKLNQQVTERIEVLEMGGYDSDDTEAQKLPNSPMPEPNEGQPMDGAFITFYNLASTQAAKQMNHSRHPFEMQIVEAPDPDDVLWSNVGKNHKQIQVGKLLSLVCTTLLCIFWTIPMGFFSTISSVEGLEEQFDWIKTANENTPALRIILAQLAPLFVVIFNALLPVFLKMFSTWEGLISNGMVKASLFSKLASFMVIQTFFISAISGSLTSQLSAISENPSEIINILANELPRKSTYFIQIIFVSTVLGMGIELLRVVPVVLAGLRSCIGPNITEKERNTPFLFLSPLAVPSIFNHASSLSQMVLFVMILFVYAVISPLTSIVLVVSLMIFESGYRHQLIYIYPPGTEESGGRIWLNFVGIILNCMMVAELTIIGVLGLKKSAVSAVLLLPLFLGTWLFKAYIQQRHFQTAECLPSHECFRRDTASDFYITESFEDLYVQPELLVKEALPDNLSSKLKKRISLMEPKKKRRNKRKKKGNRYDFSVSAGKSAKTEPIKASEKIEIESQGQASI